MKLLIVEDEAITALHLSVEFRKLGCAVSTEASGEGALRRADRENPDAVLMDIHLAGKLDGVETAKALGKGTRASIVFMSGYERGGLEDRLRREIGPQARLFPKPLSGSVIGEVLRAFEACLE
ncbi:MAG: response regulator [Treponema sp.]|nr:response regulator [Treponema sp.]